MAELFFPIVHVYTWYIRNWLVLVHSKMKKRGNEMRDEGRVAVLERIRKESLIEMVRFEQRLESHGEVTTRYLEEEPSKQKS